MSLQNMTRQENKEINEENPQDAAENSACSLCSNGILQER